ncbi:peptidoglycan binding protein CsiV [Vibrio sp.]|nr:peptidoglycan binding protein CsiV [Vibrio sp.]
MKRLVPLLMLMFAMPAMARQFDVEVIIFKRNVNAEQTQESWPNNLPAISLDGVGSLGSQAYMERKGVTLLPHSSYRLNEAEQRLRNHAGYRVLMHTAWRQGDQSKYSAPVFHILAGRDFSGQFNHNGTPIGSDNDATPISGVTENSVPSALYELDGKLQVYVQHYLYADVEMDLKEPSKREVALRSVSAIEPQETNNSTGDNIVRLGNLQNVTPEVETQTFLKPYRMNQKRRMRSGEIHYFDHPLMGMIIQVRKAY